MFQYVIARETKIQPEESLTQLPRRIFEHCTIIFGRYRRSFDKAVLRAGSEALEWEECSKE